MLLRSSEETFLRSPRDGSKRATPRDVLRQCREARTRAAQWFDALGSKMLQIAAPRLPAALNIPHEAVGIAQLELARVVEAFLLLGAQDQLRCLHVALQLGKIARTEDGRANYRLVQEPRE